MRDKKQSAPRDQRSLTPKSSKIESSSKFGRRKTLEITIASTIFEATDNEKEVNTTEMCQQLLMAGYPRSYSDFFALTHLCEDNSNPTIVTEYADKVYVRDKLVDAEVARRHGSSTGVLNSYLKLVDYFTNKSSHELSVIFCKKYLDTAHLLADINATMNGLHLIGVAYSFKNDFSESIHSHESHLKLAKSNNHLEEINRASIQLCSIYNKYAKDFESKFEYDQAIDFYLKSIEASKVVSNRVFEVDSHLHLGVVHVKLGNYEASIPYLQCCQYLSQDCETLLTRCLSKLYLMYALYSLQRKEEAVVEGYQLQSVDTKSLQPIHRLKLTCHIHHSLGLFYSMLAMRQESAEAFVKYFSSLQTISKDYPFVLNIIDCGCCASTCTRMNVKDELQKAAEYCHRSRELFMKVDTTLCPTHQSNLDTSQLSEQAYLKLLEHISNDVLS